MTVNRVLAAIGSAVVLVAVGAGLYIAGAPSEARLTRLDEQRVLDLQSLAGAIELYRNAEGELPRSLADVVKPQRMWRLPVDPETRAPYEYEVIDARSYRLCAQFARRSRDSPDVGFWKHDAGRQCFDIPVSARK